MHLQEISSNRLLTFLFHREAILLSFALQAMIMYIPFLANRFDVVPLGLMDLAWIVAAAAIIVGLNTVIHKVRKLSFA